MGGIKREVVREKIEAGAAFDEGKKPMNFEVYKYLCKSLERSESKEDVFCHLFLVLERNLMARSDNYLQISITHVQWRNDSLVSFLENRKGIRRER